MITALVHSPGPPGAKHVCADGAATTALVLCVSLASHVEREHDMQVLQMEVLEKCEATALAPGPHELPSMTLHQL